MLGELAAALAHELNQPLTAILSNAQAARRFIADGAIEPDELRAILDDIIRDDKRAGGVIHNLRAMLSKRPVVPEACCLNELVREVASSLNGEMIGQKIELRLALAPDLPRVQTAPVEVQQVLVNLLLNAVHAMKNTPSELRHIEIETRCEDGAVTREHPRPRLRYPGGAHWTRSSIRSTRRNHPDSAWVSRFAAASSKLMEGASKRAITKPAARRFRFHCPPWSNRVHGVSRRCFPLRVQ